MRIARKLLVVAMLAITAMAINAASASALTVQNEATGAACSAVSEPSMAGGCHLELDSEGHVEFQRTVFPVITLVCTVSMEAKVNGTGHGYLYNQTYNCPASEGGSGTPTTCNDAPHPRHWEFVITGSGPTTYGVEGEFCINFLLKAECRIDAAFTEISHTMGRLTINNPANPPTNHRECENTASSSIEGIFMVLPELGQSFEIVP